MTSRRDHLPFLDQFRGVAIILVFLYHSIYQAFRRDELNWSGWFRDFNAPGTFLGLYPVTWGWTGVAIFFAVSGFCIHLSHARARQASVRDFVIRRWFRIYPPFLASLIIFAFIFPDTRLDLHTRYGIGQLVSHALLAHNFNARTVHGIAVAWWSIAVEFQLYLLYPLLLLVARKHGWQRVLWYTAIIEIGMRLGGDIYWMTTGAKPSIVLESLPFYFWFSWSIGAALADAYVKDMPLPFARSSTSLWVVLLIAADLFKPLQEFSFTFAALASATLMAHLLERRTQAVPQQHSLLRRGIAAHVSLVGSCSYSIYLIHHPIVVAWPRLIRFLLPSAPAHPLFMYLCCLAAWIVIVPIASAMYRYVELPAIALGRKAIDALHRRRDAAKTFVEVV
jgi:peptidoglycan/LPS O-acetylase OafA/YrhL